MVEMATNDEHLYEISAEKEESKLVFNDFLLKAISVTEMDGYEDLKFLGLRKEKNS